MCANEFQINGQIPPGRPYDRTKAIEELTKRGVENAANLTDEQIQAQLHPNAPKVSGVSDVQQAQSKQQTARINQPIKGAELEKTPTDKNVISKESQTSFNVNNLLSKLTLDSSAKQGLLEELGKIGIQADENGNINFTKENKAQLESTISKYVSANQKTTVEFTKETDPEFIARLVSDGAVQKNDNGQYSVLDNKKLEQYLSKEDKPAKETPTPPMEVSVDATTTTKTVRKENAVDVPQDLKHNKAARKSLELDYKEKLAEWANDPENAETMKYSLAQDKYDKKIGKQLAKLKKEIPTNEEVLQKYYDSYATEDEKAFIDGLLKEAKKDEKGLLDAYNRAMNGDEQAYIKSFDGDTGEARKNIAAYLKITESNNFNPEILLERMAVEDVMSKRSDKQIEKDKKYFINAEAERQVKKDMSAQSIENTRVHFTKEARKSAQASEADSAIEHTDIGKKGRELVKAAPDEFCTQGTADDCDFEMNGKYYKFSEEKWKNYFLNSGDSRHLDDRSQDNFTDDKNLNLDEGREGVMRKSLITAAGTRRSFEQLIGNDNGKVGNRELNQYRDLAKTTGMTVDKNRTAAKRALYALGNAGLGAALGFATAGLGSVAAGAVSIAGTTAPQMVGYSGVTDPTTIHDSTTFKYTSNGETYTQTVNKEIHVDGQEYSGQVEAAGQNYKDSGNKYLKTGGMGAALGAAGGLASGLATMNKINAKSHFDGAVNLTKEVEDTTTEDTKLKLNIPQSKTITIRSGQITEESKVPTVKPVRYRGPEAYTVLYQTEDGKEIPASMKKQVYRTLNKMWREASNETLRAGDMPKNIPLFDEIDLGNGIKVKLADDYMDRYKNIRPGNPGGRGGLYNSNATEDRIYRGKGKITKS